MLINFNAESFGSNKKNFMLNESDSCKTIFNILTYNLDNNLDWRIYNNFIFLKSHATIVLKKNIKKNMLIALKLLAFIF